jgi:hypothetical protein
MSLLLLGSVACAPLQFSRPFAGQPRVTNFFDHDIPRQFVDTNGHMLTYWGEDTEFIDGHEGYDFDLPVGSPLLAVEKGTVHFAGITEPYFCPPLKRTTQDLIVRLEMYHRGELIRVNYQHMSRVDVQEGDRVAKGQVLGLSGNTGCSTGPHLHLAVFRENGDGKLVVIDPFGFQSGADPWEANGGAKSEWLWAPGQAPELFRENVDTPNPHGSSAAVTITRLRWQGVDDQRNPNNEFVEVTLDPHFAPARVAMQPYSISNNAGDVFRFPAGFALTRDQPTVRIYTGEGTASPGVLYWGRRQGVWRNRPAADCAVLNGPNNLRYTFWYGQVKTCPISPAPTGRQSGATGAHSRQ